MLLRERESGPAIIQPFYLLASDVDASVELKPAGKVNGLRSINPHLHPLTNNQDETIVVLNVMDLNIVDTSSRGTMTRLIFPTTARPLVCVNRLVFL